jgi:hypothetical protein
MKLLGLCLASLLVLAGCGGGEADDTPQLSQRLASAPRAVAGADACASNASGYLEQGGECLKKLELPTPDSTPTPLAASGNGAGGALRLTSVTSSVFFTYVQSAYSYFFGGTYTQGSVYVGGYGNFLYRYYYGSGNYLGILDGVAYIYGPLSGWYLTPVGRVDDFYCAIYSCSTTTTTTTTSTTSGSRSFISWNGSSNGVVVKDANNEDFAFYSDSRCLYSYARQQETSNFCLSSGQAEGYFAGVYVQVMLASGSQGGCITVLADYYGRQVDIYTNSAGVQVVSPQSTYWQTRGCTS